MTNDLWLWCRLCWYCQIKAGEGQKLFLGEGALDLSPIVEKQCTRSDGKCDPMPLAFLSSCMGSLSVDLHQLFVHIHWPELRHFYLPFGLPFWRMDLVEDRTAERGRPPVQTAPVRTASAISNAQDPVSPQSNYRVVFNPNGNPLLVLGPPTTRVVQFPYVEETAERYVYVVSIHTEMANVDDQQRAWVEGTISISLLHFMRCVCSSRRLRIRYRAYQHLLDRANSL